MRITLVLGLVAVAAMSLAGYHAWGSSAPAPAAVALAPTPQDLTDPNDLLPDLLPLPARDLRLAQEGERIHLRFSTTYYNQGRGPAELRADPATAGVREDIERDVLQRIYRKDGSHRDAKVGTFLWHQEHLHYHFADFISYDLAVLDAPKHADLSGALVKSTYCLRDVSRVEVAVASTTLVPKEAGYKICGKELQGVSVGWGDTYYHDYPGQSLDVSELSTGTYRLAFHANPELRLEEVRYDNNSSFVTFRLDKEKMEVTVLEESPAAVPAVEHVHLDDPFGIAPQ